MTEFSTPEHQPTHKLHKKNQTKCQQINPAQAKKPCGSNTIFQCILKQPAVTQLCPNVLSALLGLQGLAQFTDVDIFIYTQLSVLAWMPVQQLQHTHTHTGLATGLLSMCYSTNHPHTLCSSTHTGIRSLLHVLFGKLPDSHCPSYLGTTSSVCLLISELVPSWHACHFQSLYQLNEFYLLQKCNL